MNSHFTVTIHDEKGVKQFNLHKFVKKAILYALLFIATIIFSAIATILYLNHNIDKLNKKTKEVTVAYNKLKQQNKELDNSIAKANEKLDGKKNELEALSSSLKQIETLIGLTADDNTSLQKRVNLTKMTSQQRATLMQFIPNGSPIEYKGITSKYGYRIHPTLHRKEFHRGIDLRAKMKTPVYATADGIVEWAGFHKRSGFGNLIILEHNYGFKTTYAHLHSIVVKPNQFVRKGDLIGYTGNSGLSNGPHLHYEVRFINTTVNPYWFIKWTQENYNEIFEKEKKIPWQSLITAITQVKVVQPTQTLPLSLKEHR